MTSTTVAPALRALLEGFIDYAGIFPPAKVSLETAIANYSFYQNSDYAWMLRWLVIDAADLPDVPKSLDGSLSVLSNTDEARAASMEAPVIVQAHRPVYCEVATNELHKLDAVKQSGCFAKIRTGGLKPEAIPTPLAVASFIEACAQRKLAFKATAGLHHPIRAVHPLTYEANAPTATMHGFINVLMASAFAWHGQTDIEAIIAETDAKAFSFDEKGHWRNQSLTAEQICESRHNFMHSVGSCSFEEPLEDLQSLGLL